MDIYVSLSMCRKLVSYTCRKLASYKSAGKFPTKCDCGLILVGHFASHVKCRKLASYKSAGNFPTKYFLGRNLNSSVSILNVCKKFSYKMQENFLHMSTSAGKFPTNM